MVLHKGTKEMYEDGNTKLLQGYIFCLFRFELMSVFFDYNNAVANRKTDSIPLSKVEA